MSDQQYGITITASDRASAVLRGIGSVGASSYSAVSRASNAATQSIEAFGKATAIANQALELGKKAYETFRLIVVDSIAVSLEFRSANDPVVKQMRDMANSVDVLRARIGDMFIPILQGFNDALGKTGDGLDAWLKGNRKLIASGIVEWMQTIGNIAITVVAKGILLVTRAWMGWRELVTLTKAGIEGFYAVVLSGAAKVIEQMKPLAVLFSDELAKSINDASDAVGGFAEELELSASGGIAETERLIAEQDEFEKKLVAIESQLRKTFGEATAAALRRIATSTASGTRKFEEQEKKVVDLTAALARYFAEAADGYSRMADFATKDAAHFQAMNDKKTKDNNELKASYASVGASMITSLGAAITTVINGAEDMRKAMITAVLDIARNAIMAYAASSAGATFFSQAAIPVIGPILAPAAAGVAFAFVKGFLNKFATGGVVTGGIPGVDSVPILAQQNERVLTVGQTKNFDRFINHLDKQQSVGGAVAGQTLIFSPTIQQLDQGTSEQRKETLLSMARDWEDLVRMGLISVPGAA